MPQPWKKLTDMTRGAAFSVERVRILNADVAIEGDFELPKLSYLSEADQIFVLTFLRAEGSIREMERLFDISYPTVKARLAKINQQLGIVEENPPPSKKEILAQLERGEISVSEAAEQIRH